MLVRLALCALLLGGCSAYPYYDPAKPHHGRDGFRNNYPHDPPQSFWRWKWRQWTEGVPADPPGGYRFERDRPDVAFLQGNRSKDTLTWVGHATFLLQLQGLNVLTDPVFSERASPLPFAGPKRHVPPLPALEDLPHVDVVLISHNHYDHLDRPSVLRLAAQPGGSPRFLVPLGLKSWFEAQGIREVDELDWWEVREHRGVRFTLTPVQHWSKRTLFDRNRSLWGGWMTQAADFTFFFAGDSGYSRDFADIARRFPGIDLAALPIGAYEPRWFMRAAHMHPEEAVRVHRELGARRSVAMHWGTFRLTDERLDEPPERLQQALGNAGLTGSDFLLMRHGQTLPLRDLDSKGSRAVVSGALSD